MISVQFLQYFHYFSFSFSISSEQVLNNISQIVSDGHKLFILSLTLTKFPTKK